MLTHFLLLAILWFIFAVLAVLLVGSRFHHANPLLSIGWLVVVVVVGALFAMMTFGAILEVLGLSIAALLLGLFIIFKLKEWNPFGHAAWTMTLLATVLFLAYSFSLTAFSPLNPLSYLLAFFFFTIETFALLLSLTHAYEAYDAATRVRWRRRVDHIAPQPGYVPKVSVHVPTYNEPVEVVRETLMALARLDYPNFEVLVMDNNTPEEKTWRALEALCHSLGPRFRFLHLEDWPGFKSGALNFALTQTAADAEIIAVIDADYIVDPAFLKDLVPAFVNPEIAFIQTPQDYREVNGEPFLDAIYHSYRYFFDVSMPVRNEHNAIIFCGTMGLIRKSALEAIGGWDEWCITEDAEASLRILKQGYQSLYLNRTYGRGLLPYTFDGLKKQRFRWAFGGIQLLKKHWESLMPWSKSVEPENRLTGSQKYYFLSSGLQWLTDILNLLFAVFLALGGLLTIFTGQFTIRPLTGPMIILPAVFLLLNMTRFLWLLKTILKLPWYKALRSMYSFFSLSWVIALATIQGLVQSGGVFLRTPKSKGRSKVAQALASTRWEMLLGLAVLLIGISVWIVRPSIPAALLALMLVWQSSIYLSAPAFSLSAARSNLPAYLRGGQEGAPLWEGRAARWAAGMVVGAIVLVGLIQGLPQPTTASYTRYQPPQVSAQSLVERKEKPPKGENGKGNQNKDNNGNGKGKGKP